MWGKGFLLMASPQCAFSCRCPCVAPHWAHCLLNILLGVYNTPDCCTGSPHSGTSGTWTLLQRSHSKSQNPQTFMGFFLDVGQSFCLFQWQCIRSRGNKVQSNCTPITIGQCKYTCPVHHCKYRSGFSEHNDTTVIWRHMDPDNAVCICCAITDPQQNHQKLAHSNYSEESDILF